MDKAEEQTGDWHLLARPKGQAGPPVIVDRDNATVAVIGHGNDTKAKAIADFIIAARSAISPPVLAWAAANPDTLAALAGGEMVAARRDLINRPRQHHSGLRAAVTWLHNRAKEMNDPHAEAILNAAAFQLGNDIPHLTLATPPAKPQEIARDIGRDDTPPRGRFQDGYGKRPDPSPGMDLTLPNDSQAASGEGQEPFFGPDDPNAPDGVF